MWLQGFYKKAVPVAGHHFKEDSKGICNCKRGRHVEEGLPTLFYKYPASKLAGL